MNHTELPTLSSRSTLVLSTFIPTQYLLKSDVIKTLHMANTSNFTGEGSDEALGNMSRAMVKPLCLEVFKKYVNTPLEDV